MSDINDINFPSVDNSFEPPTDGNTQQNYNNYGSGPQIANNNGPIINGNVYILSESNPDVLRSLGDRFPGTIASSPNPSEWAALSDNLFNIFILDNENYRNNAFCMPYRFCLPDEMTDPRLKKRFKDLDEEAIRNLCSLPCIFAHRNSESFKKADPSLAAVIGRLTEIYPQTDNIKFVFEAYKTDVGQQLFNDHASELGLIDVPLRNELDMEHWSVKSGDLKGFILSHGIIVCPQP